MSISEAFVKKQESYYRSDFKNHERIASPGNQYIVQLIKGGYLEDYTDCHGKRVLDMGCGSGFNMVSFAMMGWKT